MTIFLSHCANKGLTPFEEDNYVIYIASAETSQFEQLAATTIYAHHKATTSFVFFKAQIYPYPIHNLLQFCISSGHRQVGAQFFTHQIALEFRQPPQLQ